MPARDPERLARAGDERVADVCGWPYDGPDRLRPGFDVLVEAARAGDFEATLSWYLGLSRRACWSVRELHDPDRVVIDLPH